MPAARGIHQSKPIQYKGRQRNTGYDISIRGYYLYITHRILENITSLLPVLSRVPKARVTMQATDE